MTSTIVEQYRIGLAKYSEDLLVATVDRAARFSRSKRSGEPAEQMVRTLENEKIVAKLIAGLTADEQIALTLLRRAPFLSWRWDHAVRLLQCSGIESPYPVLQELLACGLLWMSKPDQNGPLIRFDVQDGIPLEWLPRIAVAAPLLEVSPPPKAKGVLSPIRSLEGWRRADGWEWPVRLAILWQRAWLSPIKRTQQGLLFKRDKDRLLTDPLLSSQTLDSLALVADPGIFVYMLAQDQGWLDPREDEQSPKAPLTQIWPSELTDVLHYCARGLVTSDSWNELGAEAPVGSFPKEMVAARFLILDWLSFLDPEEGAGIEDVAARLERVHPTWQGVGELAGPLRNPIERGRFCRRWVRQFLLGAAYQCALVEVCQIDSGDPKVRLTSLGRAFLGQEGLSRITERYEQTLLVQPNHQIVVFRQGLSIDLLTQLVLFAEPQTGGAALTLEITPASVYHGLESGLTTDSMLQLLSRASGRPLPGGVEQSILTWGQKRERLAIYENVALFEFSSKEDMQDAIAKGLEAEPVTDRIALVEQAEKAFKNLRITASRDYRLEPQPCVQCASDGVTLHVDLEKSDLMLESELQRFADPVDAAERDNRRTFRITRESLERAFDQGWRFESFDQWFRLRTGAEAPPSTRLLLRALGGLTLQAGQMLVLRAESPLVADGLQQHPATKELFAERIGPSALLVDPNKYQQLGHALTQLGVELEDSGRSPEKSE